MRRSEDFTFTPKDGEAPSWVYRKIAALIVRRGDVPTRFQGGDPKRTRKQDGTYFKFLEWIAAAYYASGDDSKPEAMLHRWYKMRFLPIIKAEMEMDTGEAIDIGKLWNYPDGSEEFEYSIRGLTVGAMARYIDMIAEDDDVKAMGVPVPTKELLEMMDRQRQ